MMVAAAHPGALRRLPRLVVLFPGIDGFNLE